MINPQLLQHLSRVNANTSKEDDDPLLTGVDISQKVVESSTLMKSFLFGALGWITCSLFTRCLTEIGVLAREDTFDRGSILFVIAILAIVPNLGSIYNCLDNKFKKLCRDRAQRKKIEFLQKISLLLGSLGAPMLPSPLRENDEWLENSTLSSVQLVKLLSLQSQLLEKFHHAVQILQSSSRFVAGACPIDSLPLPVFREQLHNVMHSNRQQLEDLLGDSTLRDSSESIPSTQNLRRIRMETVALLSKLCERVLLYQDPPLDSLREVMLKTEKMSNYLSGLMGSLLGRKGESKGVADDLALQAQSLQMALIVLAEDSPFNESSVRVWRKALHMSESLTRRLEEIIRQVEPLSHQADDILGSNSIDDANTDSAVENELTFEEGASNTREDVKDLLNEKIAEGKSTLVYRTTVAPRAPRRRRKISHSNSRPPLVTPFEFLDELSGRLQRLPTQLEIEKEDPYAQ